jgi:hypothetical protein
MADGQGFGPRIEIVSSPPERRTGNGPGTCLFSLPRWKPPIDRLKFISSEGVGEGLLRSHRSV